MQEPNGKLVRDRIPEVIRAEGRQAVSHVLDIADYRAALRMKLVEEAAEASEASEASLLEELADVYEVLTALAAEIGKDMDAVRDAAEAKAHARGGFSGRIWLDNRRGQ